jgi:hypothetical protein
MSRLMKVIFFIIGLVLVYGVTYYLYVKYVSEDWPKAQAAQIEKALIRDCSLNYSVDYHSITEDPLWRDVYQDTTGKQIELICVIPPEESQIWECQCNALLPSNHP